MKNSTVLLDKKHSSMPWEWQEEVGKTGVGDVKAELSSSPSKLMGNIDSLRTLVTHL